MSEFNQAIAFAKRQQRRRMVVLFIVVASVLLVLAATLMASQGTRIKVLPEEAAQQAELRTQSGLAFIFADQLYSLSSEAEIQVSAPEFAPATRRITDADFGKVTTVTLKPLPGLLRLSTTIANDKTEWFIDDKRVAVASQLEHTLEAGEYTVKVSHPYFEAKTETVHLGRDQTIEKQLQLTPVTAEVNIHSKPAGAAILIDDNPIGNTPTTLKLNGGKYNVKIDHPQFEPIEEIIEVTQLSTQVDRDYQLAAKRVKIPFAASPTGGTLTVNGQLTPVRSTLKIPANQENTLTYSKPGFTSQTQRLKLKAGESQFVHFELKEAVGKVELRATPAANVSIGGQALGKTPLTLNLPTWPLPITFSLSGYRTETRTLTPKTNATSTVSVILQTEKQAAKVSQAATYMHHAGGNMTLFRPNETFRMGAERSEPGQRANEFVRDVQLNRAFYAGEHEVTNASYRQFQSNHSGDANLPVTRISWIEAAQYCNWLSEQENLSPVYEIEAGQLSQVHPQANGYRLLTEAEWEWLARKAGRETPTQFAWGDNKTLPRKAANIADESAKNQVNTYVPRYDDGYAGIAPVKSMNRELSGLYDFAGNVSEWTHDSYSLTVPKTGEVYRHELDTRTATQRVVKGANWRSGSLTELRAAYRHGGASAQAEVGFRLARFVDEGE